MREVEAGTKDGIVMLLKTPERERYMDYTAPLITSYSLLWYSEAHFPRGFVWSTVEDLQSHQIGITQGYSYGELIDSAIARGTLQWGA